MSTVVLAATGLAFYLLAANLGAEWGIADDHEIHAGIGQDHRVGTIEATRLWWDGEAGHPGGSGRYRPVYYALRFLEMRLWGGSVRAWYLARILLFALTLAVAWWTVARLTNLLVGGAFVCLLAQQPYWSDVFARLGPSEAYAAPALAIFALGMAEIWRGNAGTGAKLARGREQLAWLLTGGGALVAIGSKENFVFLSPLLIAFSWWQHRRGLLGKLGGTLTLAASALAALVLGSVWWGLLRNRGTDFYGEPVTGLVVADQVVEGLGAIGWLWLVPAAVIATAVVVLATTGPDSAQTPLRRSLVALAVLELTLLCVVASQIYFYRGIWPLESRYALPGQAALLLLWFVPLFFVLRLEQVRTHLARVRWPSPESIAAVLLLISVFVRGFGEVRSRAESNRIMTRHYSRVMRSASVAAKADPSAVVAVRAGEVSAVEGTIAAERILRFYGVDNSIVAVNEGSQSPGWANESLISLLAPLWEELWNGKVAGFASQERFENSASCIEVIPIAPPTGTLGCQSFGVAWKHPGPPPRAESSRRKLRQLTKAERQRNRRPEGRAD